MYKTILISILLVNLIGYVKADENEQLHNYLTEMHNSDMISYVSASNKELKDACTQLNAYGYYDSITNTMVMCDTAYRSYEVFYETLRHETIHLVQDCLAGIDNEALGLINGTHIKALIASSQRAISTVNRLYTDDNNYNPYISFEYEAWTYEEYPATAIIELLEITCS